MALSFPRTLVSAYELARGIRHPLFIVVTALLVIGAAAVAIQLERQRTSRERETHEKATRVALLVEQNVFRIASDLERILYFLRVSHSQMDHNSDWAHLVSSRWAVHDQVAQVAIIDAAGKLVTSTSMPKPDRVVDLSDREHFRFHLHASVDQLFISKPVLGRASGKWTIQFTRRLEAADGTFVGVAVVSLDPAVFADTYDEIDLGDRGGLAILGADDTILAGTGAFAGRRERLETPQGISSLAYFSNGTSVHTTTGGDALAATAVRAVKGFPLSVVVRQQDVASGRAWQSQEQRHLLILAVGSIFIVVTSLLAAIVLNRREREVLHLVRHDALTGLANRSRLLEALQGAADASGGGAQFALHLIDLDGFKGVNDTWGHVTGDRLLAAVGERLRSGLRAGDVVARLGGDEFGLLQTGLSNPAQACAVATRVCELLGQPFHVDGHHLAIGASVGVFFAAGPAPVAAEVMRAADLALYTAKGAGKGTFRVYAEDMSAAVQARHQLEAELRRAVAEQQFELHYQPIVSIETTTIVGYEALIRWRHPERGLVPPAEFVPLAESTGLIVPIGAWVLERACSDMAGRPLHLKVAVNVSPIQFRSPGLADTVLSALQVSGLAAHRLELEITETTLMQSDAVTSETLAELVKIGIQIAMDDFGTGYSSLSYLRSYPISCIKIDRSFVKDIGADQRAASIIRAITSLARGMGLSTIVEGVETKEQLAAVASLGCTEAQGFLFSRPMRAQEILPPAIGDRADNTDMAA